jgi:DNA-binding PadR family transcriptional regulator
MSDHDARSLLPLAPHVLEILLALAQGPAHGYALIRRIGEQSDGAIELSTSSLYAALAKMAQAGLVADAGRVNEGSGGPPRRTFRITALGRRAARLEAVRLRRAVELTVERLGGRRLGRGDA